MGPLPRGEHNGFGDPLCKNPHLVLSISAIKQDLKVVNVLEIKENWKWLSAREFVETGDEIASAVGAVLPAVIAPRT
ncbi:MAG: hypothetical protein WCA08_04510 [Desulfoferrobacter sp.]